MSMCVNDAFLGCSTGANSTSDLLFNLLEHPSSKGVSFRCVNNSVPVHPSNEGFNESIHNHTEDAGHARKATSSPPDLASDLAKKAAHIESVEFIRKICGEEAGQLEQLLQKHEKRNGGEP